MNYKSITIISIIVTAIFVMPLFSFSGPGVPFQVLQNQIDDLQQQIDGIQKESVDAFFANGYSNEIKLTDDWVEITSTSIPGGNYVGIITVSASYYGAVDPPGYYDPNSHAYFSCKCTDKSANPDFDFHFSKIGGMAISTMTHSRTWLFDISDTSEMSLSCKADFLQNEEAPLAIPSATLMFIRISE